MKNHRLNLLLLAIGLFALIASETTVAQGRPENPGRPETPGKPENAGKPETPANPEQPETPANPEQPDTPDEPEVEIDDEEPEVEVEEPEVDEDPETPETPDKPDRGDVEDEVKGNRPDFVDEAKAIRETYDAQRKELRDALREKLAALGKDASKEDVQAAVNEFREQNAQLIADQKAMSEDIKKAAKEDARGNVPDHVRAMRDALKNAQDLRKKDRKDFKADFALAETQEAKKELMDAFRSDQRLKHRDLRDTLKQIREDARNAANDGDRRSDG